MFDKTAICGPILWNKFLSENGNKNINGIDIKFHLLNENKTATGKAIQDAQGLNMIWN